MLQKKKSDNIFKLSLIITVIVIIGKVIGFVRDAVIAGYYGATWRTDAFFLAQNMPSTIFPAVCGSLSTAFISLYVSRTVEKGNVEGERFASRIIIVTLGIAFILSIIGVFLAPLYVPIIAPGFSEAQLALAIDLSKLTMGAFVLTMGSYMLSAILNSKKFFYGSQIAGVAYNVTVIVITLILGQNQSMELLTVSVIIGHLFQVIILMLLLKGKFKFTLILTPFHKDSGILIKLAFPIFIGNFIVQINHIIGRFLASYFQSGALSALSYSASLNRFITGIFITTLSTVIYPSFIESLTKNDTIKFISEFKKGLIILPMIILPVSIIGVIEAFDIVSIVFKRGYFDIEATKLTAIVLTFYAGMYVFVAIQEIITRAFYALKDTKTPMIVAAISVFINIIISVAFSKLIGLGGIALGTTLSSAFSALLLWINIKKKIPNLDMRTYSTTITKIIFSAVVMIIFSLIAKMILNPYSELIRFISVSTGGLICYFGLLLLMKCKEIVYVKNMIIKKLKK